MTDPKQEAEERVTWLLLLLNRKDSEISGAELGGNRKVVGHFLNVKNVLDPFVSIFHLG